MSTNLWFWWNVSHVLDGNWSGLGICCLNRQVGLEGWRESVQMQDLSLNPSLWEVDSGPLLQ